MLEQSTAELTPQEAHDLAREAYVFGLPFVENYKLLAQGFLAGSPMARPADAFIHFSRLFTPKDRDVVSPNNDTLYSEANLDLRGEPVLLETPDLGQRYFCIQLVDLTTNNLPYIGTRATGNDARRFLIAGPEWDGAVPPKLRDARVIRTDSRFVLALLRIGITRPDDVATVTALQPQFRAEPLHAVMGGDAPALPDIDWPPYFEDKQDEGFKAFEYVNFMMQWHRFSERELPLLRRLARIGVRPGRAHFDEQALSPDVRAAMLEGIREARATLRQPPATQHGWEMPDPKVGNFGEDYALRARVAWNYLYANSPAEAIYPIAHRDSADRLLDGGPRRYVLRFPNNALPPARFFWSLTAYDAQTHMLVDNPIQRYSLGGHSRDLVTSSDGSLSLFLQHASPEPSRLANWLPVPDGPFYVLLRIYGPSEAALQGQYTPPAIEAFND
ncbi:DUF1254 domain-containing protein [Corallococcus sp. M34]|uniref:DUF1254 domain-containing protein n=1 Tax=Citreicoccus inhibens TaxID=2849499 RepID=UPI001C248E34|nr:DUF1254 domain-containing protein [Citreicoccus inhibens]MBU8897260.1 DUF1254 domain-containing protein [Citreicoccus inhibens]